MKHWRLLALAFCGLLAIPLIGQAQVPVVGPQTYTFTAGSQSNVWTCNGGQSSFALTVPSGLTGTLTVTTGQTMGSATSNPPWSYAPGAAAYTNTITNSGSLTVNLGSNLYVKVADTSYSSGSVTVTGVCSGAVAVIPPQGGTPAPTPSPVASGALTITGSYPYTFYAPPTPTPGPSLPISLANGGTATSAPSPSATATSCGAAVARTGSFPSETIEVPVCASPPAPLVPGGRLTLTSNKPVMTADVTGATSVYYTPYAAPFVPIYSAAGWGEFGFSQLTMTLNATYQTSGNIYDLFLFNNSGTIAICAGPAWLNTSTRSATISLYSGGVWVNTVALTSNCYNGATAYSIAAVSGTYIGSVYMTANGQTAMQFKPAAASGGSANILGLYNAYNRVPILSQEKDSTASWTYGTSTWRESDASAGNRITWLDGLQQSFIDATFMQSIVGSATSTTDVGLNLNATTGAPLTYVSTFATFSGTATDTEIFYPQLGLNYLQGMEINASGSGTSTFLGGNIYNLVLALSD